MQEAGRGGRDGSPTDAILYYSKKDFPHTSEVMRAYCDNKQHCRRAMLMAPFCDSSIDKPKQLHMCCDVCAAQCKCTACTEKLKMSTGLQKEDLETFCDFFDKADEQEQLSPSRRKELYSKLLQLQKDILSSEPASALVGPGILCGLCNAVMISIVKTCLLLKTPEDVQSLGITSSIHAKTIYEIVTTFQS